MKRRFALVLALIAAMVALPTVAVSQSEHSQEELDDAVDDAVLTGREMPAKFGGLWFDGMTVFVAFTAQADGGDIRKVTDLVPGWAELRVVQVDWSEAQLVDVYEEITRDMVAQDVPYVIGVGVSPKDNHVEVAVLPEQYEREQDAVREAYGRVALEIVASERDQGSACTRYDCWDPPFKGGLSIRPCVETLCVRGQRQRVLVRAPSGKSGPDDDQ